MSNLGIGVMLGMLSGNEESARTFQAHMDKEIKDLGIVDNALLFTFADDSKMKLFDDGQSCCESRHMNTDDDLSYYIGAALQGAEVREGPNKDEDDWGEVVESEFLIVSTSKGQLTVVNYNAHNGYYGGFLIRAGTVDD